MCMSMHGYTDTVPRPRQSLSSLVSCNKLHYHPPSLASLTLLIMGVNRTDKGEEWLNVTATGSMVTGDNPHVCISLLKDGLEVVRET
jgi:hypothetical protein